ncbi:uncharacterized protein MELLADRAFT_111503 [Melampsora larici-populina 98AG31]|uniref:Uncharacterized protein n=1 Tax=Melampsora larici-populina (strain 98AG31 / pathotype 3-4-7) TaxID=747676 RepID=F4S3E0_MELLP|nr:uncharacterized protein MELLADRAFT_111503 [Melampsora larici-populina 98AG31]EGG00854.1 hypothetical protein MELLADRAFT_111503 [Melampsora larici-populina 98AG31]
MSSTRHRHDYLNLEPVKSSLSLFRTSSPTYPEFLIGYPDDTNSDYSYGSESVKPTEIKEWSHRPNSQTTTSLSNDPISMVVNRILTHEKDIHNEVIRSWIEATNDPLPDLTSFTTSTITSSEKNGEVESFLSGSNSLQPVLRRTQSLGQLSLKQKPLKEFDSFTLDSDVDFNQIKKTYRCTISSSQKTSGKILSCSQKSILGTCTSTLEMVTTHQDFKVEERKNGTCLKSISLGYFWNPSNVNQVTSFIRDETQMTLILPKDT